MTRTLLAFETSCPYLSVALGTREGKIKELRSKAPLKHSENFISLMDRLLRTEKIPLEKIDAFAVDRGPGSFTGLRIGLSFLQGFMAVKKKPCYGALSLDMISAGIPPQENSRLGVLVDARRETLYSRFYLYQKGKWRAEGKLEILSLGALKSRIREGTILTGDALMRYRHPLEEAFEKKVRFLPAQFWYPSAATLVKRFQAGDTGLEPLKTPRDFLPLYLRASEAEERRRTLVTHGA